MHEGQPRATEAYRRGCDVEVSHRHHGPPLVQQLPPAQLQRLQRQVQLRGLQHMRTPQDT